MLRDAFGRKLGVGVMICALLTGCGSLSAEDGGKESGIIDSSGMIDSSGTIDSSVIAGQMPSAEPAATEKPGEAANMAVSGEGMDVDEYLEAYGVEEYDSEYLHLKAVEGIRYVLTKYDIEIYRDNIFCGWIYAEKYDREDWMDPQYVIQGARELYEALDIPQGLETSQLAMLYKCDNELYGQPATIGWLLEKGYFKEDAEMAGRTTVYYLAVYGVEGSCYGYHMNLSAYLVEDEMLESLLGAVEIKERGLNEEPLFHQTLVEGMPASVLHFNELLSVDSDRGYTGNRNFAYFFSLGNTVYEVPMGTIAVMDEDGKSWKLYAFMEWYLSEIGDIRLFQAETEGKSMDDIIAQYVGEDYRKDCLNVNETGVEYRNREGNTENLLIVDGETGNAIMVNRFAPGAL